MTDDDAHAHDPWHLKDELRDEKGHIMRYYLPLADYFCHICQRRTGFFTDENLLQRSLRG